MATLKLPGLGPILPTVPLSGISLPPVPFSMVIGSLVVGLNNTSAALAGANQSSFLFPPLGILQFPIKPIYPSNFTSGASIGYPI